MKKLTAFVVAPALVAAIVGGAVPKVAEPKPAAAADPPVTFAAKGIADTLLDKVGGALGGAVASKGIGFLMTAIGFNQLFPSDDEQHFRELKAELDAIAKQVGTLQASVKKLSENVLTGQFDTQWQALQDKFEDLKSVYDMQYKPMIASAAKLKAAETAHDNDDVAFWTGKLVEQRKEFVKQFDQAHLDPMANKIHNYLVPGQGTSLLAAKGKVLMSRDETRYLTRAQSQIIRSLYDAVAAQEALAAWLRMERWLPTDPPGPHETEDDIAQQYRTAVEQYRDNTVEEHINLPPVLPVGVVLDPGALNRSTTDGKPMFVPGSDNKALQFRPGGDTGPGTVPDARKQLNAKETAGFSDWDVPSQKDLTTLLSGNTVVPDNGDPPFQQYKLLTDFLRSLNTDSDWILIDRDKWPFLWADDVVNSKTLCTAPGDDRFTATTPAHMGVALTSDKPVWSTRPQFEGALLQGPASETAQEHCKKYVEKQWTTGDRAGGFLAARTTPQTRIDYMAQGPAPNIRKESNLRYSDFTSFALMDVNMSGFDLSHVTFTQAQLDGTNLGSAKLLGARSGGTVGTPKALPTGWKLINGFLVGPGADLSNTDLSIGPDDEAQNVDLSSANLSGVTSGKTRCSVGCTLPEGWQLVDGYLVGPGANLTGAVLPGASLRGADLRGANLTDANFTSAHLEGARFTGANVTGTNFTRAFLDGVTSGQLVVNGGRNPQLDGAWRLISGILIGPKVDLSGADGAGLNLTGASLAGADLTGVNLTNANLTNADLRSVILTGANVTGTDFSNNTTFNLAGIVSGNLVGTPKAMAPDYRVAYGYFLGPNVNLGGAQLSGVHVLQFGQRFMNANFTGANLSGAVLVGMSMSDAILTDANLAGANLGGSILRNAQLRGVRSGGITGSAPANLPAGWKVVNGYLVGPGANLEGANLDGANLAGVDLRGAILRFSSLSSVNFTGANLDGVIMSGSIMSNAVFSNTRCPDGVIRSSVCPFSPKGRAAVTLTANAAATSLVANVDPDLGGTTSWQVVVELLTQPGGFVAVAEYTTKGKGETLNLNLAGGTYRVWVKGQNGYAPALSAMVTLKR